MTINHDYIALTLHNDRSKELQRAAAKDRLTRQATRRLRPRRRVNRDQHPAPSIPRQRSAGSQTTAKVA